MACCGQLQQYLNFAESIFWGAQPPQSAGFSPGSLLRTSCLRICTFVDSASVIGHFLCRYPFSTRLSRYDSAPHGPPSKSPICRIAAEKPGLSRRSIRVQKYGELIAQWGNGTQTEPETQVSRTPDSKCPQGDVNDALAFCAVHTKTSRVVRGRRALSVDTKPVPRRHVLSAELATQRRVQHRQMASW